MIIKAIKAVVFACFALASSASYSFDATCPDAEILGRNLIDGVCWDCLLPMSLLGGAIDVGNGPLPQEASPKVLCTCDDPNGIPSFGVVASLWLPNRIYEVVKTPFCSPTLSGTIIGGQGLEGIGGAGLLDIGGFSESPEHDITQTTRFHAHGIEFPLMTIIGMLANFNCLHGGAANMDMVLPPSEFLPNWNDEELSLLVAAESLLFANPLAALACGADCIASSAGNPINSMFWCAGCWGLNVPLTGTIVAPRDNLVETSLSKSRYMAYNHRMGALRGSVGSDAMCGDGSYEYTIPKDNYRTSMIYPVNESSGGGPTGQPGSGSSNTAVGTSSTGECCHYLGESPMKWGLGRNMPGPGESHVYLMYQYSQCCITN